MLRFEVITKLDDAQFWWKKFSTNETIYDDWDFRFCFYKYFNYPLFFVLGYDGDVPVGVLPLQEALDEENKPYLEFFGGDYMEQNHVLVGDNKINAGDFYRFLDKTTHLEYISQIDAVDAPLDFQMNNYYLDLTGLTSYSDYIEKGLSGKRRKHIRADVRKFEEAGVAVLFDRFTDLEKMIEYNLAAFGEESVFEEEFKTETVRDWFKLPLTWRMISVEVAGKLQGVSLAVLYGGVYTYLVLGTNRKEAKDIDMYMHLQNIGQAIKMGAREIDFGYHDCGWKDSWGLNKKPLYKFWI